MKSPIIVGPRCCGKTERSEALAKRLVIPFVDADKIFETKYGTVTSFTTQQMKKYIDRYNSPEDYAKNRAWNDFREKEAEIIRDICLDYRGQLISLAPGGGAVAHNQGDNYRVANVRALRDFGTIFYILPTPNLEESALILTERERADDKSAEQRPPLNAEADDYQRMLKTVRERHSLYQAAAHHTLYTGTSIDPSTKDKDIAKTVDEICDILEKA